MTAAAAAFYNALERNAREAAPPMPQLCDLQCEAIARVYCAARAEYARERGMRPSVMQFSSMSEHGKELLFAAIRHAWKNEGLRNLKPGEEIADWRETALLHRITQALTGVPGL